MGAETTQNSKAFAQIKLQSMDKVLHEISCMDEAESEEELAVAIMPLLQAIGEYTGADRVYIFDWTDETHTAMRNAYEWCAAGVTAEIENFQAVPINLSPDWMGCFHRKEPVIIENIDDIGTSNPVEYAMLQAQGVYSMIAVPIYAKRKLRGVIGMVNAREGKDEFSLHLLTDVGGHLGSVRETIRSTNLLKATLDSATNSAEIISSLATLYTMIVTGNVKTRIYEIIVGNEQIYKLARQSGSWDDWVDVLLEMFVAPSMRAAMRDFLNPDTLAQRMRTTNTVVYEFLDADGGWHLARYIVKSRDANGDPAEILYVGRDIAAEKRQEHEYQEKLRRSAEEAERANASKTAFLRRMSHDIRTPLNGIIGMINLAEQYADDPEMQKQAREKALESLDYLVSLVNDVLDMNKIQSGNLENHELTFNMADALCELNRMYTQKAARKGIAYKVNWDNANMKYAALVGNPVYLGRILSNIADNAIKFSPAGSTITVSNTEEMQPDGRVMLTFRCKDEGVGMSEEFIKHAFDMFAQEKETSRAQYEGSGLGLAIVKQLADRMGGSVTQQSKIGVGTTVTVKLPFKIGQEEATHRVTDFKNVSIKGIRALVVDDNELNREIAQCILENNGMEVTCAQDGQEAVEIYERSAPGYFGVVYMDIMMPRMNGLDAARAIRAMKRRDAEVIPIIAMSANAFAEDIINSRLAGIDIHLAKPLDEKKMIAALQQCLADNTEIQLHKDL